ncbi:MAG: hypothetical protein EOO12_05550 [Chitinophagaceae bacterium]|nr:MAG: hypothetical protein EOO12_05550 [Chitinophagaceae bacterium]
MHEKARPTIHFSTVLFVDGQPVSYELVQHKNTVRLVPDSLLALCRSVPEIEATRSGRSWRLEPSLHRDLADQVLEDLARLVPC